MLNLHHVFLRDALRDAHHQGDLALLREGGQQKRSAKLDCVFAPASICRRAYVVFMPARGISIHPSWCGGNRCRSQRCLRLIYPGLYHPFTPALLARFLPPSPVVGSVSGNINSLSPRMVISMVRPSHHRNSSPVGGSRQRCGLQPRYN